MKKAVLITPRARFDPQTWELVQDFVKRLSKLHPWIWHADVFYGPEAEIVVEVDKAPTGRLSERLFRDMARISTEILLHSGPHIVGAQARGVPAPVR